MFNALVLEEAERKVTPSIQSVDERILTEGNVEIAVSYSTVNYKDGMVIKGLGRLVKNYPHIPGIDYVGSVTKSEDPRFSPGDKVLATGYRIGELYSGGFSQQARNADWLVPLPNSLTEKQAMAIGSAGFTAMLALMAFEEHGITQESGEILVTGATGGVGSIAIALLANLGYHVTASTGKTSEHEYLKDLGAKTVVDRAELSEPGTRPLESERWAACVDNVGGTTLSRVLAQLKWQGSVASIGMAGGNELHTSVLPFLLRGINLLGIDSNACPMARRQQAWNRLPNELPLDKLDGMTIDATLGDLPTIADEILTGKVRGRIVVDVNA